MPIRLPIMVLFVVTSAAALFAQSAAAGTPASAAPEKAPASDSRRLSISNPFFFAYKNQFYAEVGTAWQQQSLKASMPAQTVTSGGTTVALASGTSETTLSQWRAEAEVRYGITDRIIAGVSALYLLNESQSTTNTGSFATFSFTASPTRSGFYNPWFSLCGRLLGVDRNDWYLDIKGTFSPGIQTSDQSAYARTQSEMAGGIALGRNQGDLTVGLGVSAIYSPEATNNNVTYKSTTTIVAEAIVQYDFRPAFVRFMGGLSKYVDSNSGNDPLAGKARVILGAAVGMNLTDSAFLKGSLYYLMPISADYAFSSFTLTLQDKGGPSVGLTAGFSF